MDNPCRTKPGHSRRYGSGSPKRSARAWLIFSSDARAFRRSGVSRPVCVSLFEELVRKFNEENNEEAGEHWTPRDAVRLMANLVFLPIESQIKSGTYLLYDCACGTGGMLTVGEETLTAIGAKRA